MINKVLILNAFRPFPLILGETGALLFGTKFIDLLLISFISLWSSLKFSRAVFFSTAILIFFIICGLLFITINGKIYISSLSLEDIYEIFRYIIYGIFAAFLYRASVGKNRLFEGFDLERYAKVFMILAIFFILIRLSPIAEFADLLFMSGKFKTYNNFFRVFPITPNPNWSGILMVFFLHFYFSLKGKSKLIIWFFLGFILLSGSRTAFIGLIYVLAIYNKKLLFIFFLIICVLIFYQYEIFIQTLPRHQRELLHFVMGGFKIKEIVSLATRFDIWGEVFNLIKGNLMFGLGPLEKVFPVTDNQFLKWLLYYGIFGICLFIVYFYFIIVILPVKYYKADWNFCIHSYFLLLLVSLTGAYFDYTQLVLTIILYVSLTVSKKEAHSDV